MKLDCRRFSKLELLSSDSFSDPPAESRFCDLAGIAGCAFSSSCEPEANRKINIYLIKNSRKNQPGTLSLSTIFIYLPCNTQTKPIYLHSFTKSPNLQKPKK